MSYGGRRITVIPTQVCSVQDMNYDSMIRTAILCTNGSEHIVRQSYEQVLEVMASCIEYGHTSYWDDDAGVPRRKHDGWYFVEKIWNSKPELPEWLEPPTG